MATTRKITFKTLLFIVLILAFETLFIRLAIWQYNRMHEKFQATAAEIYAFDGVFLNEHSRYLENQRLHGATAGRRVLTPFRADYGDVFIVDRGWLARPAEGRWPALDIFEVSERISVKGTRSFIEAPKGWLAGPVESTQPDVLLRVTETAFDVSLTKPVVVHSQVATHEALKAVPPPIRTTANTHLGYMLTWLALALITPVLLLVWLRRTT